MGWDTKVPSAGVIALCFIITRASNNEMNGEDSDVLMLLAALSRGQWSLVWETKQSKGTAPGGNTFEGKTVTGPGTKS